MVTLQEQISGSLLRSSMKSGPATVGPLATQGAVGGACTVVTIPISPTQTVSTVSCPPKYTIIKKTFIPGPPYPVQIFGERGYAVSAFWSTGTAFFMQTPDRKLLALRADGTVKVYRPRKHIVVSSNPRVKNLVRARDRIDSLSKRLRGAIGARALSSGRGKKR